MTRCHIQNLAMLSAVLTFAGCHTNKTESTQEADGQTENVATESVNDSIDHFQKTIEGTVISTVAGKDGYSAQIELQDGAKVTATISRINLSDPKQFRHFNANEIVTVKGEYWKMGQDPQLTVREIL